MKSNNNLRNDIRTQLVESTEIEVRSKVPQGEHALLSALLFDGIQAFINFMCAESEEEKKRYQESVKWIHSEQTDYVFSFNNVCECLGIEPNYLRAGLINAANSQMYEWHKIRRHS
jgi:hypothetical protein